MAASVSRDATGREAGRAPLGAYRRFRPVREPVEKATAAEVNRVLALASQYQTKIADAIMNAFLAYENRIDTAALIKALTAGDLSQVMAMLNITDLLSYYGGVVTSVNATAGAAALLASAGIKSKLRGVEFWFNALSPGVVTELQQYDLALIRQIDDKTREGIRQFLVAGMKAGKGPREIARDVRTIIGLTDKQQMAVMNFRSELETFHQRQSAAGWNLGGKISRAPGGAQTFAIDEAGLPVDQIFERRLRDFRYDKQLKAALASGKPLTEKQIDKMVDAYARKYLKHRAETIARTESLRAANMGVMQAWTQAVESGKVDEKKVVRKWFVSADERTCLDCAPIPGMNPKGVPLKQPFKTPVGPQFYPPLHVSCRCVVFVRTTSL